MFIRTKTHIWLRNVRTLKEELCSSRPDCICVSVCVRVRVRWSESAEPIRYSCMWRPGVLRQPPPLVRIRAPRAPVKHTYAHTLPPRAGQHSSWPGSPAARIPAEEEQRDGRLPGASARVTVDLPAPYFVDMGDMGDPPKSKTPVPCWGEILGLFWAAQFCSQNQEIFWAFYYWLLKKNNNNNNEVK